MSGRSWSTLDPNDVRAGRREVVLCNNMFWLVPIGRRSYVLNVAKYRFVKGPIIVVREVARAAEFGDGSVVELR